MIRRTLMKKIILAVLCAVLCLTLTGCFQKGPQYENLDTNNAVDPDTIKQSDFADDLDGLVKYLKALNYLPVQTEPTVMLAEVIGAKKGYRYIFTVDNSNVVCELYEYDTSYSDPNASRVIEEIKETGSFHLFNKEGVDTDTTYPATLSDSGKYVMLYGDGSSNQGNVVRKKLIENTVKAYYSESSKTSEASETSKTAETSETSKAAETSETSKTAEASAESKADESSEASKAA